MNKFSLVILAMMVTFLGFSQEEDTQKKSNVQEFTPSKLLSKGQWDIKFFNSLYTKKKQTGAEYSFLLGGATKDDEAEEKLPMLNHVMSYPTAIFLDKKKNIVKIHTGFYGPSTGKYYDDFTKNTDELIQKLLLD